MQGLHASTCVQHKFKGRYYLINILTEKKFYGKGNR